eukprot:gene9224-16_t
MKRAFARRKRARPGGRGLSAELRLGAGRATRVGRRLWHAPAGDLRAALPTPQAKGAGPRSAREPPLSGRESDADLVTEQ